MVDGGSKKSLKEKAERASQKVAEAAQKARQEGLAAAKGLGGQAKYGLILCSIMAAPFSLSHGSLQRPFLKGNGSITR